jgi:hypothetical protein
MIRKISVAFAGGALGGLVDSFNIWFMGKVGVCIYGMVASLWYRKGTA